jgi:hypothetical protein
VPTVRVVAALFALLSLYYVRFFLVVRAEAATLVQIALLLCAAALLVRPPIRAEGADRRLVLGAAALLAAFVFILADHDAHSASDTLNRIVPAYCLLFAFTLPFVRRLRTAAPARPPE